ncbi:MAG: hypothetical protein HYS87_03205 [Candidatus Colwellbacteria bacterium]|nr:hypothetical protein [Candidatus Colwellbacteria bacterium]
MFGRELFGAIFVAVTVTLVGFVTFVNEGTNYEQDAAIIVSRTYDKGNDFTEGTPDDSIYLKLDTKQNGVGNYTILANPEENLQDLYKKIMPQGSMLFWYYPETHQIVRISILKEPQL